MKHPVLPSAYSILNQFHLAAGEVAQPEPFGVTTIGGLTSHSASDKKKAKSFAQVAALPVTASLAIPCASPKPKRNRSVLSIQYSQEEKKLLQARARQSGLSLHSFVRTTSLQGSYQPPLDTESRKLLLMAIREMTAQGNNLNQIARLLNAGMASNSQAEVILDKISQSLLATHCAIRHILLGAKAQEPLP